jgi:hypothetical protein
MVRELLSVFGKSFPHQAAPWDYADVIIVKTASGSHTLAGSA